MAGNVLIAELTDTDGVHDEVWIGFSQKQQWDDFLALNQRAPGEHILPFIGSHVVADTTHHLGFYFDPNITEAGETVATEVQTSIDRLKQDPLGAEQTPFRASFIPAVVVRIVGAAN
jgi:hypothetical protein